MSASHAPLFLCLVALTGAWASVQNVNPKQAIFDRNKIELYDGVNIKIPKNNGTKMLSLEIDANGMVEGRGSSKKLLQRLLPLFIMPFLIQSTIVPMFLSMLKFMLIKSLMIGKVALVLIILNAFKNHNSFKGRNEAEMADIHYGYHGNGMEEYGAYFN